MNKLDIIWNELNKRKEKLMKDKQWEIYLETGIVLTTFEICELLEKQFNKEDREVIMYMREEINNKLG